MKKTILAVALASTLFANSLQDKQNFCVLVNYQQSALIASVGGRTNSALVVTVNSNEYADIYYLKMKCSNGWDDIRSNALLIGFKAIQIITNRGNSKFYYFVKEN